MKNQVTIPQLMKKLLTVTVSKDHSQMAMEIVYYNNFALDKPLCYQIIQKLGAKYVKGRN